MPEMEIVLPKFVTPAWIAEQVRISDEEAATIAAALADANPEWLSVKDVATYAETFLSCFEFDPDVASQCRKALGKKSPPILRPPSYDGVGPLPDGASAKQAFGHYAACARAAAEEGDDGKACEYAALEMLEFGSVSEEAFSLAHDVQHLKKYAALVEFAKAVEQTGLVLALMEEGLERAEAEGEARASVAETYAIGRLSSLAEGTTDAEEPVEALREVATALAEAARNTAAHTQIASAPLGTDTAIAVLRESIGIIEEHLEGSEDPDLMKMAEKARKTADGCKEHLISREATCQARLKAQAVREQALEASSLADEASRIEVKNLADAKKMEKGFLAANDVAKKACEMADECAKFISSQKMVEANDQMAEALFSSIEEAFSGARSAASEDVKATAEAAAELQRTARESSKTIAPAAEEKPDEAEKPKAAAKPAKEKPAPAAPAPAPESAAPAAAPDAAVDEARQKLLEGMEAFAAKRWDTNLATQTLRRLVDRRKEVIGQLWEAVENRDDSATLKAEKFVEQFRNTMDARRRLDAVVRLMGRGESMDPRTAKWFTDSILDISSLTHQFILANKG